MEKQEKIEKAAKQNASEQSKTEVKQRASSKRKAKKVVTAILATLSGFSAMTVASAVIAYDSFFERYERPNYELYPGEYCFERVSDRLKRDEFYIKTKGADLKCYYYPTENAKGLVIIVHGLHAGADDFIPFAECFVKHGFNVFSYDGTGVYDSKGDSTVGMCQSLVDLDNVLNFIKNEDAYKNQPLYLMGHSQGGYAVTSILSLHKEVKAVAAVAPINNAFTVMVEKGEQYVGKVAQASRPIFSVYQRILFKDYVNYDGVKGINSVDIPIFIAQGVDDKSITYDKLSITAYRDSITNPNVEYYLTKGVLGSHLEILYSVDAVLYRKEVASDLKLLEMNKGTKLTTAEKAEYNATVNHKLYSSVNEELMVKIIDTFDNAK
ncbi:MAG: alpha/beta fold hydrolase [Clostridiales bacterium]|nr:alpha/beta fold hydrolase [Clostridiales bacterium]